MEGEDDNALGVSVGYFIIVLNLPKSHRNILENETLKRNDMAKAGRICQTAMCTKVSIVEANDMAKACTCSQTELGTWANIDAE